MRTLLLFLLLAIPFAGSSQTKRLLEDGDILFQKLPCGGLCDAIIATTPCAEGRRFNHCGIVKKTGDSIFVIEAIGRKVQQTPLQKFLARDTSSLVSAGRPHWKNRKEGMQAAVQAANFIGRPYDDAFLPGDSALYCSELVWEVSKRGNEKLFRQEPMTFKSAGNTHPGWVSYYNDLGVVPPEGVLGINPCGLATSPNLEFWQMAKVGLQ